MFENYKTFKTTFAGRELMVETGKVCGLANGSCWVHYGETVVMVNVTASAKPREGVDFFPLAVDYEEKLYAVGKIPGGYLKREGRPSEKAILNSRVVDRPMRPLFPKDMRNDVAIVMTVLAVDPETQPEIIAMIGASIAVSISDIPWNGPIGGISVGLVDGEIVLMPNAEQRAKSDLQLTVASSEKKVVMIEAGANEVDDDTMLKAIMAGHEEINKSLIPFIKQIQAEIGKPKFSFPSMEVDHDLFEAIQNKYTEQVKFAPALSRNYILTYKKGGYSPDFDRIIDLIVRHSRSRFPTRFMGFPAYTYFLLRIMDERKIYLKMPKGSRIMLGGGWKQFYAEQTDKISFYSLVKKVLGIKENDIIEFFGAVEHPILYCDCKEHHFHVPAYSRVIIRDVDTLKPLENGKTGLVNLITPMVKATPVLSVMTDDLGILHNGSECSCGLKTPFLEIVGRVAPEDIKTCAAGAEEIIKGVNV